MRLNELFDQTEKTERQRLEQSCLAMLTPMLAQKVPFITVDQMIEQLRKGSNGLYIDRSTVIDLCDPTNCQAVEKIEADKIYLKTPGQDQSQTDDNQKEQDSDKMHDTAVKQAQKAVSAP